MKEAEKVWDVKLKGGQHLSLAFLVSGYHLRLQNLKQDCETKQNRPCTIHYVMTASVTQRTNGNRLKRAEVGRQKLEKKERKRNVYKPGSSTICFAILAGGGGAAAFAFLLAAGKGDFKLLGGVGGAGGAGGAPAADFARLLGNEGTPPGNKPKLPPCPEWPGTDKRLLLPSI